MPRPVDLSASALVGNGRFIFVSYARADSDLVYPEVRRLESEGYRVWCDRWDIQAGRPWTQEINKAIKTCSCFLLFATQASVQSPHVREEIEHALDCGRFLININLENVQIDGFKEQFQSIQSINYFNLHNYEYREQLGAALVECVGVPKPPLLEVDEDFAPGLFPQRVRSPAGIPPKVVFFVLVLLASVCFFLAAVVLPACYFTIPLPGNPLVNLIAVLILGLLCVGVGFGLGGAAFVIHWRYLRRKDG